MALYDIDKFRYWSEKVLPTVFDDALSYSEVLGKVVVKLNEIIDLANSQNEQMTTWYNEINANIATWESEFTADIEAWQTSVTNALNEWKTGTITDIETKFNEILADLEDWEQDFVDEYNALKTEVEQIAADAETAKNAAAASATAAAGSATSAEAYAESAAQSAATLVLDDTLSIAGRAADAKATGDAINNVMSHVRVAVILKDINESNLWANGTIGATSGENVNNDARIRTASALASDILQIKNSDATIWKYMVLAYTSNTVFDETTYIGAWFPNNQTKFAKSTSWIIDDTDIATLDANYPTGITKLYYRIVVAKQASGQLINKNDDYIAIQLIKDAIKVDKTLTESGIPADAKAVGDAITVIAGKNLEYYQLENKSVHDFLDNDSLKNDTSYTSSVVENYIDTSYKLYSGAIRRDHPAPIRNVFDSDDNLDAGESPYNQTVGIWVSDDDFGHYQYFKGIGNYIEIDNLIPGKTYKYRVYGFTNTFNDRLIASGSFVTNAGVRMCNVPGIQNVRDLGGWTGFDSRKIKYEKLYRGCELTPEGQDDVIGAKIWDEGIEICRNNLKIRSELDLSTVDRQESLFGADIEYMHIDGGGYAEVITSSYYRSHFKQMFEWIIKQLYDFTNMGLSVYDNHSNYNEGDYCLYGAYDKVIYQATQNITSEQWTEAHWKRIKYGTAPRPIYFHCQGGNDRTGTLSALLLALLGVDEFTISQEYELSAFSKTGFSRRRNSNNYKGLIDTLKSVGESNDIGTAVYNWATTLCGISVSDINNFRSLMLNAIN